MSDCEDTDSFWESWISSGKRKRKKESKKVKKCLKRKNNIAMKTEEHTKKKKKKKTSKFNEAMEGKKEKKKEKKKKKNRLSFEVDGHSVFTLDSNVQPKPTVEPETLNPHSSDKLKAVQLTQDSRKKTKKKKKVAFDLSPGYIRVKRPKFVSSSQQSPIESVLLENETVRDSESCSQVIATGHSQGQTHNNDSQCTSEDINSQDLFITQKTFRAPSLPSSDEASDKVIKTTPAVAEIKQHHEVSLKYQQEPHFHQHHRATTEHVQKQKLSTNLTEGKIVPCPVFTKPHRINPYLDEHIVVTPSPRLAKSKKYSTSQQSPPCLRQSVLPLMSMTSTTTQTENFFTTELSSYLNFCQKRRETLHFDDLEPLDLSLAQRARKDMRICLSVKTSSFRGEVKCVNHKNLHPFCSSDTKDVEVQKECPGRHLCSISTQSNGETAVSPQSESEHKSEDTTTSSEDNEQPCRTGKLDLAQVRAVQMKLNESFFFKTKGEGQSPRPESPLMKLAQSSREVKSRKGH